MLFFCVSTIMSLLPIWKSRPAPETKLTNTAQIFRTVTHMSGTLMVPLRRPGADSLLAISLATHASRWYALHTVNKRRRLAGINSHHEYLKTVSSRELTAGHQTHGQTLEGRWWELPLHDGEPFTRRIDILLIAGHVSGHAGSFCAASHLRLHARRCSRESVTDEHGPEQSAENGSALAESAIDVRLTVASSESDALASAAHSRPVESRRSSST
jgi:hypothetical protein